jgi:selenocysteine lyase/cysteine desulfurase
VLAAYSSVGELSALGQKRIEAHVISLARSIETGLKDMHIPIYEIKEEAERSSIVSIGEYGSTPQWVGSLHEYLQWHEIITSVRRGMLRISLHFYNSEADVTHLLAHLERWKAGRTIPPPSFPGVPRNESD